MDDEKCVWCNKETALAVFGVLLGLLFIAMSVDVIRRTRIEHTSGGEIQGEVISD